MAAPYTVAPYTVAPYAVAAPYTVAPPYTVALYTVRYDGHCTTYFPPCLTDNDLGAKEVEISPPD